MSTATIEAPQLSLPELAQFDRAQFVETFGGVFEHSPWVAEAAWASRPFASLDALHAAMIGAVLAAPIAQQLAFLNLHPELAGKEAEAGTMTDHSTAEQAGLSALETSEVEALRQLNAQYAARHGFPFVIAVLANTKSQIFEALRRRIAAATDSEREAALAQIGIITRLRLGRLFAAA